MTSSIDAGATAEEGRKIRETKCPQGGSHEWEVHFPRSPSQWGECKKCGATWYCK